MSDREEETQRNQDMNCRPRKVAKIKGDTHQRTDGGGLSKNAVSSFAAT